MKPLTKRETKELTELVGMMKAQVDLSRDDAAAIASIVEAAKDGDFLKARYLFRDADTAVREYFGPVADKWLADADETETFAETFTASIYVGSKVGYSDKVSDGYHRTCYTVKQFCDEVGWCVTVETLTFCYTSDGKTGDGFECGHRIGIIQYPRFREEVAEIRRRTMELARRLREDTEQQRVTVVFSDFTVTLGGDS